MNLSKYIQCPKLGEIFTGPTCTLLTVIVGPCMSLIPNKTTFTCSRHTALLNGFQSSPWALKINWNPPRKAVPGKFHGSSGHSKRHCLQDRDNFHRSRAWQIVVSFNTAYNIYTEAHNTCESRFSVPAICMSWTPDRTGSIGRITRWLTPDTDQSCWHGSNITEYCIAGDHHALHSCLNGTTTAKREHRLECELLTTDTKDPFC